MEMNVPGNQQCRQRRLINVDVRTYVHLKNLDPIERALSLAKIQKQQQGSLNRSQPFQHVHMQQTSIQNSVPQGNMVVPISKECEQTTDKVKIENN